MSLFQKCSSALAVVAILLVVGVSAASAATFDSTLSSPVSGTNTKQTIEVSSAGDSSSLSQITITEPSQFNFSFPALGSAADKCPYSSMPSQSSTFDPTNCPSQAKVGTITVNTGTATATGDIYLIEKSQFAWLGVDISPTTAAGNPSNLTIRFAFVQSWPFVDPTCDPLTSETGWCEQIMQLRTTSFGSNSIVSATITLGGPDRGNLPGDLFYVPTYATCDESYMVKGVVKNTDNSVTTTYDGDCPFAPTYGGTLTDTTAGALVGITWHWENQVGSSNIKRITVDADTRLAANIPAFGSSADQCPSSAMPAFNSPFDSGDCPAQAKIGSLTLESPDYLTPAVGDIYIVDKSPVPWLAAKLTPGNTSVKLVPSVVQVDPNCDPLTDPAGFCQSRFRIQLQGLPNVRTTSAQVVLDGPDRQGVNGPLSGKFFYLPTDCETPLETTVSFLPFLGTSHSVTEHTDITGC